MKAPVASWRTFVAFAASALVCAVGVTTEAAPASPVSPGGAVQFLTLKAFQPVTNPRWDPLLTDIMRHRAPGDTNQFDDRLTLAHEITHGINAYIRNTLNSTGKSANGFYVLRDRAALVVEPSFRKSRVAE